MIEPDERDIGRTAMLSKEECQTIHAKNNSKRVWLENLAANDMRLVLRNADETLHVFWNAEFDKEEQAQAARLCGAINELVSAHPQPT